jgi:hypothetical protein
MEMRNEVADMLSNCINFTRKTLYHGFNKGKKVKGKVVPVL